MRLKVWQREKHGPYYGPVVFREGKHYPCPNGHPDLRQHVLWNVEEGCYFWAYADSPTHQHLYERAIVDLPVHGEE